MNQLDYIAENQRLREEIERLKAFPPVSVRANVLDLALQCAELKAELEKVTEKQQKKCSMCGLFENKAYSLFTPIGSYKRYIFNYCPMCGRKLNGDDGNDRP